MKNLSSFKKCYPRIELSIVLGTGDPTMIDILIHLQEISNYNWGISSRVTVCSQGHGNSENTTNYI